MYWLKRDIWKAGFALAGLLLLLVLMIWVPVSAAGTYQQTSRLATPETGTVSVTPEDATVTALNKEKLEQEVQQLKKQNEPDLLGWIQTNSILLSTLVVVIGGLIGYLRWYADRRDEREKRVEELFQAAVTGLGDEKEGAKIGAAILLRSFLGRGYERYYTQVFDLAAANLRLPRTTHPPKNPNTLTLPNTGTPPPPEVPTALSHALMVLFVEAFPLAREQALKQEKETSAAKPASKVVKSAKGVEVIIPLKEIQSLSARGVCLDNGYLWYADLKQVWMADAFLRGTDLMGADLSEAILYGAHLEEAYLWETKLCGATLWQATLCNADLKGADLSRAILLEANLSGANLRGANLDGAKLVEADLTGTNLEDALSLKGTKLHAVIGLKIEQKEACNAKGAIITEAPTTSPL
jgi:Pentapeptide repeats (8 copies)